MSSVEALRKCSLFAGIQPESVGNLRALGEVSRHEAGERLFDYGSEARDLLILESGAVDLFFPMPILGATRDAVVERLAPGDVLAWSALVSPYLLTLSARCVESSEVLAFTREALSAHLKENPDVGYQVMRNLAGVISRRLHDFQQMWIREAQSSLGLPSE